MRLKAIYLLAIGALAMTACSNNRQSAHSNTDGNRDEVYTGVMPAADAAGIRYTLHLDYDDDHNFTDGDYDLTETYIAGDTTAMLGYKDLNSFRTEGDFTVETGIPADKTAKYIKLVPDRKYGSAQAMCFLISSDSTLTLLDAQLAVPQTPGLNYTLTRGQ